jgi:hypothetical protein
MMEHIGKQLEAKVGMEHTPNVDPPKRPEKPPYGSPCNGCGGCCEDRLCVVGVQLFGRDSVPCPALDFNADATSACGLTKFPQKYCPTLTRLHGATETRKAARILIGAGIGCDALIEGEERPAGKAAQMQEEAQRIPAHQVAKAIKIFGLKNYAQQNGGKA